MLMVIIGAGASYDSSPDKPPPEPGTAEKFNRPPLANNLFADFGVMRECRSTFPKIDGLIPEINPRPGRSIEESLQRIEGEAKTDPVKKQQLLAIRYYLQDVFRKLADRWRGDTGGVTNYKSLLGRIAHFRCHEPDPVLIVTFNYDTLIEAALTTEFRMKFEVMDDYTQAGNFRLFKLHGSENWGRYLHTPPAGVSVRDNLDPWAFRTEMIEQAGTLVISDTFAVAGTGAPFSGPPLYPAISIPVRDKGLFECPGSQVGLLESLIPRVTKIITIGWRGAEGHFLKLLARGLVASKVGVDIVTVAGTIKDARETLKQIEDLSVPLGDRGCLVSFSDCISDLQLDGILRR